MTTVQHDVLDLSTPRRIHVVGIGGAGMSAIALVLSSMGHEVSGSDLKESPTLERLRARGIDVFVGHDPSHVGDAQYLAISTAVPPSNVEVEEAKARAIPVLSRAAALSAITRQKRTIAISGTHGKTTTSSMLALILVEAGMRPSFIIGGDLNEIGTNAAWGEGEWLVVEADESDGTFLELDPQIALVTNVDADHLDFYGSFENLTGAFQRFLARAPRAAVVCADDERARSLAPVGATSYGFSSDSQFAIHAFSGERARISFQITRSGAPLGEFEIPVPGEHNARNAAGAIAVATGIGVSVEVQRRALARFAGVARRFEFRGERGGVSFVDDYAHLPGEVAATLKAAKDGHWNRIVCVFQPHRYSRVESLASAFATVFDEADLTVITDIYPAGEEPRPGVSARLLVDAVRAHRPEAALSYIPARDALVEFLRRELRPGDCCLTLGAGDITSLPNELLADEFWEGR